MRATEDAMQEVMRATGLNRVGAAFLLGRSDGDPAAALADWWTAEHPEWTIQEGPS